MKRYALVALLFLAACAKSENPAQSTPVTPVTSIVNVWVAADGKVLDLSKLQLNQEMSASLVILCDGTYGNSGKVNGMSLGNLELGGTETAGVLLIGHLQYVGASNPSCRDYSKETYQYQVNADNTMTLCMKNYAYCGTYVKQ